MVNYVIIENEAFSLIRLKSQIEALRPQWNMAFSTETVEDSVEYFLSVDSKKIDLVFIDIELDDGNCFEIFRQLAKLGSHHFDIPVIFTTSYDQYVMQAFQLNSVDYLLKPVMDEDLKHAIEKWERISPAPPHLDIESLLGTLSSLTGKPVTKSPSRILITVGDRYRYEEINNIAYFLAEDKAVIACLKDGKQRLTDFASLNDVLPILSTDDFYQISRGVIANITAISQVSKFFKGRLAVILRAGNTEREVIVTAARKDEFLNWYGFRG